MEKDRRFAVLIDADNVSDRYIKLILDEVSNEGILTYKRIYADWTKPSLSSWKNLLLANSITPIQQYSYTAGKIATDSAMIIDAMDILYSENVEGFCIVSSNSDFTRLAVRLREAGKYVIGMGDRKTPQAFVVACNRFVFLEALEKDKAGEIPLESVTSLDVIKDAIKQIVDDTSDEEGWCPLSDVGNTLLKRYPDFDVRNYGFTKLTPLIKHLNCFEIKSVAVNENIKLIYIRNTE
ncbi:MAG TPA: NYN domain-containing protein [Clostridia bacterium]|jgi:uncharacterized LabA/DUF88 family protein|nr:NYN domain-containing protein [Clostridia bacterium]